MAFPSALLPSFVTLKRELSVAEKLYRQIAAQRVKDDAPVPEQHAYWRAHDTVKGVYARLDWRLQKMALRVGLILATAGVVVSFVYPPVTWVTTAALTFLAWRFYAVLLRLTPGEDDKWRL